MQFKLFALLTIAAASVSAAAVSTPAPAGACTCGPNVYSANNTQNAITQAHSGTYKNGLHKFPRHHKHASKKSHFPPACSKTWNDFPILAGGTLYKGGKPGPDRVVYDDKGGFCGCLTHTGAKKGHLQLCH